MTSFTYTVIVDAATQEQADQVMNERTGFDEDYGFNYTIDYEPTHSSDVAVKDYIYEWIPDVMTGGGDVLHVRVKRVARDGSWADIQVTQPNTGATWSKRQLLNHGRFTFHARQIGSVT